MDMIHVNDIRAFGYSGALPEENILGQWFRVDLQLALDLAAAGASDGLADTYNYAIAVQLVQQLIRQRPFNLVETVASEIAKAVLHSDPRLLHITVKLTKLTPPIPDFAGTIAVEITRDRTHLERPSPPPLPLDAKATAIPSIQ
ncbi:MAG TPA: dihydroneopterin aldolase [Candidatus Obscuribacterales bacterium]